MQITDIKVRKLFFEDSPMKAIISVTFDQQLALHDIKVIHAKDKYFIVMPSKQKADETYHDIVHPINREFRAYVEEEVLNAYFSAVREAASAEAEQIDRASGETEAYDEEQ